jgi:ubiquinone/menaquinone biosynthesis C-methylase UbiE
VEVLFWRITVGDMPVLRPDYQAMQRHYNDSRPPDRLIAHYVLERELAAQLLETPREERAAKYTEVYDKLFEKLPDHPQHKQGSLCRRRRIDRLRRQIQRYVDSHTVFLEIGCGDAALSISMASSVGFVIALDVTDTLIDRSNLPNNLHVLTTTSTEIPLDDDSVDFIISDQLMEHLHPDDATAQLAEIYRVLKPGGIYYCITPNRVIGPHDISNYFDYETHGFHLREYDSHMLRALFQQVGFSQQRFMLPVFGLPMPRSSLSMIETLLLSLPASARAWASRSLAVGVLVGLNVIATK